MLAIQYPDFVISRVKCIGYIIKGVLNSHFGSNPDPCYTQSRVIMNRVIKRFRCIWYSDTRTFYGNHSNRVALPCGVMSPFKDADGEAISVDPDQTAPSLRRNSLNWVYAVCPDLSVQKQDHYCNICEKKRFTVNF